MLFMGINSAYHESAAAILDENDLLLAVEEERFTRVKRGKEARIDNPHELPLNAMAACLAEANASWGDLDGIGFSLVPGRRLENVGLDGPHAVSGSWGTSSGEREFDEKLRTVPAMLSEVAGLDLRSRVSFLSHHLCHAASAVCQAPFEEGAFLVVDGIGEIGSALWGRFRGRQLQAMESLRYPHSIGFVWEKLSEYLGFSVYDACKVMGLAAYGRPEHLRDQFSRLARLDDDGLPRVDLDRLRFRVPNFEALEEVLGPARRSDEAIESRHEDIAAAMQDWTDRAVQSLARRALQKAESSKLAYAGGVALNCVTNSTLRELPTLRELYLPPGAHDAGTAIGAAFLVRQERAGQLGRLSDRADVGPSYSLEQCLSAMREHGLEPRVESDPCEDVAERISNGQIVGWFSGRCEFGPRALGHRSLFADPRNPATREYLNLAIKHREPFRPFAASILPEHAWEWFEDPKIARPLADHMLGVFRVRPDRAARVPSILHVDDTCRLHVVDPQRSPGLFRMLGAFYRRTGIPMVLNTSFNDSEPIVLTPRNAIETYLRTKMDALYLEGACVARRPKEQRASLSLSPITGVPND